MLHIDIRVWVWIAIAYVVGVIGITQVIQYFFGWKTAMKVGVVIGFPIRLVWEACLLVISGLARPWKHRSMRLLKETFEFDEDWDWVDRQAKVDEILASRAESMQNAFDAQEAARKSHRSRRSTNSLAKLREADKWAKFTKDQFWSAHALADEHGFGVYSSYQLYLALPTRRRLSS